jgi:hypothetical protein
MNLTDMKARVAEIERLKSWIDQIKQQKQACINLHIDVKETLRSKEIVCKYER